MESRTLKVASLWALLACAGIGTYYLSNRIESRAELGTAGAFLAGAKSSVVYLTADKAEPDAVEVGVGDEVLFKVKDRSLHDIAEDRSSHRDARLESGEIGKDESYSLVFGVPGSYSFYDRMHQDIRVSVTVR